MKKKNKQESQQFITQNPMQKSTLQIFIIFALTVGIFTERLFFHSPQQLKRLHVNGIDVRLSPIGFNPRSGQLDGTIVMASPFDACSPIDNVENEDQDVFVLANDQSCLQSIKSKNIMKSGALMGIIRENINNTLHDKELDIVHIPIIELNQEIFDSIVKLLSSNTTNSSIVISTSIIFGNSINRGSIVAELWMSPTQIEIYTFLVNMEKFFNNQKNEVKFTPRYAMHSQKDRKSFIGCYSNGMYCPGELDYDGRLEGQNIIEESLRQMVIRGMGIATWWKYIKYFYVQCLHNNEGDVFMSSESLSVCTRNSMILADISYEEVEKRMKDSFMGPRKQVDDNYWLHEERKDYISEKISEYPVLLINKKEFTSFKENDIKLTICKMEQERSEECSQLMDGSLHKSEIILILGIVMIIVVLILIGYKVIMYRRMQKEMKSEVVSTLDQYYRYMETLEADNNPQPRIYKARPDSTYDISHETKQSQEREEPPEVEIEMATTSVQQKRKNAKEGHETLTQEENH